MKQFRNIESFLPLLGLLKRHFGFPTFLIFTLQNECEEIAFIFAMAGPIVNCASIFSRFSAVLRNGLREVNSCISTSNVIPEFFAQIPRERAQDLKMFYFNKSDDEPFDEYLKIRRGRPENKLEWLFVMYDYNLRFDKKNFRFHPNDIYNAQMMFNIGVGTPSRFRIREVYLEGLCNIAKEDEEASQVLDEVFSSIPVAQVFLKKSAACPPICLVKKFKSRIRCPSFYIVEAIKNPYVSDDDTISMNPDEDSLALVLQAAFASKRPLLFERLFELYSEEWQAYSLEQALAVILVFLQRFTRIFIVPGSEAFTNLTSQQHSMVQYLVNALRMHSLVAVPDLQQFLPNFPNIHPEMVDICMRLSYRMKGR